MKSPYLERFEPIKQFYPSGSIMKEKYLVHMSYVVYHYSEDGKIIGLTVNGIEFPPESNLEFREDERILLVKAN